MPSIAVLGASRSRAKFGNKCVRAYRDEGWTVVPIHPDASSIEGLAAVASLADLPEAPDRVSVYLPPTATFEHLEALRDSGAGEVWFNPGSADPKTLERARELGITVVDGCSIVDIGRSPSHYN